MRTPEKHSNHLNNEGFTLLEMALALLICGIMISAGIALYTKSEQQQNVTLTHKHMGMLVEALADYVESANRLPCPARPAQNGVLFGWENGVTLDQIKSGAGTIPIGSCADADEAVGIIPFQTLDLPYQVTLDGWGNPFTYAVSRVFTQNNDPADHSENDEVHARCRTPSWVTSSEISADNLLPPKARFCCAVNGQSSGQFNANTDIVIKDENGASLGKTRDMSKYGSLNQRYEDDFGVPKSPPAPTSTTDIAAPAFIIISHGPNAEGYYTLSGVKTPNSSNGLDDENNNLNLVFRDMPANTENSADYFDDIVVWMTQDGIMAANGASSCQYP